MNDAPPQVTVTFTAELSAAYDTLLAVESFAHRQYHDRAGDPRKQQRYNDLAPVVEGLRLAVDGANR